MTTETDLKQHFETYAAAEPPLGFDAASVRRIARRQERRTRAATLAGVAGVTAAAILTGIRLAPGAEPDPAPAAPPRVDTAQAIRALARSAFGPDVRERQLYASTWTAYPGYDVRPLPPGERHRATDWTGRFAHGTSYLGFDLGHQEPDWLAAGGGKPECRPGVKGCRSWRLPDGRIARLQYSSMYDPARRDRPVELGRRSVEVFDGTFATSVSEMVPIDEGTDPARAPFKLDVESLTRLASDRSLRFPMPDPAPKLPSWQFCLMKDTPPAGCPKR